MTPAPPVKSMWNDAFTVPFATPLSVTVALPSAVPEPQIWFEYEPDAETVPVIAARGVPLSLSEQVTPPLNWNVPGSRSSRTPSWRSCWIEYTGGVRLPVTPSNVQATWVAALAEAAG